MQELLEEASVNLCVAQLIYDARTAAGLTQKQLVPRPINNACLVVLLPMKGDSTLFTPGKEADHECEEVPC